MASELTQARLRELLHYDPETGVFTRLLAVRGVPAGSAAGTNDGLGYLRTRIDGKKYKNHRLAWFYMTGSWPVGEVDHINGERADNRWENLRDGDRFQNQQNQRSATAASSTGLLGANRHRNKFVAQIRLNGTTKHIGCFQTPEEAHAAYIAAKREMHAGCTI